MTQNACKTIRLENMNREETKTKWRKPGVDRESVLLREDAYTSVRRQHAGAEKSHRMGVALSGGGIRSACFSLGVLSWLERSTQWKNIDYVSSVSGGGYAAASVLGQLPGQSTEPTAPTRADQIRERLKQGEGYLKPTAAQLLLIPVLALISGVLALSPILLLFGQATPLFTTEFHTTSDRYIGGLLSILFTIAGCFENWRKPGGSGRLLVFLAIVFGSVQVSYLTKTGSQGFRVGTLIALSAVWAIIFYILSRLPSHPLTARIQRHTRYAVAFFILLTLAVGLQIVTNNTSSLVVYKINAYLYFSTLLLLVVTVANPNTFNATFKIYHEGLRETFGGGKDKPFFRKELHAGDPIHLVNCFLQSPNSDDFHIRDRGGENFCASKFYCGAPSIAYFRTKRWHRGKRGACDWTHQKTWRLIATSGAALDTHPTRQSPIRNALLSVLNLGLGAWVINPSYRYTQRRWWPSYFLNFILALNQHTSRAKWIRLSDGGHFENLGIYELIARECMEIIVVDAGHDPDNLFCDLAIATQRCWDDFGAKIEMPDLFPKKSVPASIPAVLKGTVAYRNNPDLGSITYIKLGVSQTHSLRLRLKPSLDTLFPHEPTTNQFSTREFVDSYFDLGYESAMAAIPDLRAQPVTFTLTGPAVETAA